MKNKSSLSRFIAKILRHNPDIVGIELDANGWADVEELIQKVRLTGSEIDRDILDQIVATDDKRRYFYNADKSKIRAVQGHSIEVDLQLKAQVPPDILYHGTAEKYLESIKQGGIEKRSRNYVHLSWTQDIAINVGKRHGKPVALKIDAKQMAQDGYKFYLSQNNVWLTDYVPVKYIMEINNSI